MREKTLGLLGLMRRAGALIPGMESSQAALAAGKGKLLLLASDAAENARSRAEHALNGRRALLLELPFTRAELGAAIGADLVSVAAVTDLGFAAALVGQLAGDWPERYGDAAGELGRRLEKQMRRKGSKKRRNKEDEP